MGATSEEPTPSVPPGGGSARQLPVASAASSSDRADQDATNRRAIVWHDLDLRNFALFGAAAGAAADSLLYPMEVIKTRLQYSPLEYGHSLRECVRRTWAVEGTRGFFKGFSTMLATAVPMQALSFGGYEYSKHLLESYLANLDSRGPSDAKEQMLMRIRRRGRRREGSSDDEGLQHSHEGFDELLVDFTAGAAGEVLSGIVWIPTDIVTQKLQVQRKNDPKLRRYRGGWDCASHIVRHEGIRGLYRGIGPTLATYVPSTAVQFSSYQQFRRLMFKTPWFRDSPNQESHVVNVCSGALAGALAAVVANPLDVVKTRVQTQEHSEMKHFFRSVGMVPRHAYPSISPRYRSTIQGLRLIVREEGMRGLTRGMTARILAMAPYSAITFGIYEIIKLMSLRTPDT